MTIKRPRVLRRLWWGYIITLVVALGFIALFALNTIRHFYIDETFADLEARALLLRKIVAAPLLQKENNIIDSLCKKLGKEASNRITIALSSGEVVGDSDKDPSVMESHADRPEIKAAISGATGKSIRFSPIYKQDMICVAVPVEADDKVVAVVRVAMPVASLQSALHVIYIQIALAGIMVLLLASAVGLMVDREIRRQVIGLLKGVKRFASGDLTQKIPESEYEELATLHRAMNQMASQLSERMQAVVEQKNEIDAVFSGMVEAVLVVDNNERIRSVNAAAERLLGFKKDKITGRNVQEIIFDFGLQSFVRYALSSQGTVEEDVVFYDPAERFLQAHGTMLNDVQGKPMGVLIVLADVTRLKKLEDIRKDFVANVSHELKTPITTIKGYVETLRDGAMNDKHNLSSFLEVIEKNADRLSAIIDDLLSLSRIEQGAGKGGVRLERHTLQDILASAITACRYKAEQKNILISLACEDDIAASVNPMLLEQAVANLIDNAINYSESGQGINIDCSKKNDQVVISVTDHGCGIPADHIERIFERFYRVDRSRSRKLGGTGLGLAIVKHIVQAHAGDILVQSTPGTGSTFSIVLPIVTIQVDRLKDVS
ncbi:MAG: ATP-binding protein [Pseudomonadota bacterium]